MSRPTIPFRICSSLLMLALLSVAVCASLPPVRPITDIRQIAGRWQGQIKFGRGSYELFYLTINRDGSLIASWDGITRHGKVTLEGPRTRFSFFIWSGNLDYLGGNGNRVILMKEDFSAWDALVRPLR